MRKSGCDEKNEDALKEVILAKNFTLKNSQIFHNIESIKDETLEADPNLERSMPICQGTEKMPAPYLRDIAFIYLNVYEKNRQTLFKLLSFLRRKKHSNSQCFYCVKL